MSTRNTRCLVLLFIAFVFLSTSIVPAVSTNINDGPKQIGEFEYYQCDGNDEYLEYQKNQLMDSAPYSTINLPDGDQWDESSEKDNYEPKSLLYLSKQCNNLFYGSYEANKSAIIPFITNKDYITLTDHTDDVIKCDFAQYTFEFTDSFPDMDITNVSYQRLKDRILIICDVKGSIDIQNVTYNILLGQYVWNDRAFQIDIGFYLENNSFSFNYEYDNIELDYYLCVNSTLIVSLKIENVTLFESSNFITDIVSETVFYNQWDLSDHYIYRDIATSAVNSLQIKINKPVSAFYINNMKIIPFPFPLVFGQIDINVTLEEYGLGDNHMFMTELYVDNKFVNGSSNIWNMISWDTASFGKHTIKVIGYDIFGNRNSDESIIWKFF